MTNTDKRLDFDLGFMTLSVMTKPTERVSYVEPSPSEPMFART